jgi:hypothetical protein
MRAHLFSAMMVSFGVFATLGLAARKAQQEAEAQAARDKVAAMWAAQHAADEQKRAERAALFSAGKLASVNTVCPVTGDLVDPAIAPVPVELMLVQPSEVVMVGVANEAAAAAVRHDPERYLPAAQRNQQARAYTKVGP